MKRYERYLLSKNLLLEDVSKIREIKLEDSPQKIQDVIAKLSDTSIEDDWKIYEGTNSYTISNSYHVLDNEGTYVGWADFDVKFPKDEEEPSTDFDLVFTNKESVDLAEEHGVFDFLENEIADVLSPPEEPAAEGGQEAPTKATEA